MQTCKLCRGRECYIRLGLIHEHVWGSWTSLGQTPPPTSILMAHIPPKTSHQTPLFLIKVGGKTQSSIRKNLE